MAAISLLALVATTSMLMQRHMAGNFSDSQQARQAATAAVSQGAAFLFNIDPGSRIRGCARDCFPAPLDTLIRQPDNLPARPEFEDGAWWHSWAAEAGIDPLSGNRVSGFWLFEPEPPRFLIEETYFVDMETVLPSEGAPAIDGIGYYRVLGRGTGRAPASVTVSEAIVAHPWLREATGDSVATPDGGNCASFRPWYDCGVMAWRERR
jgi:Tfp pilus assembly protein PilX